MRNCQRRTGSAFGVAAYFKDEVILNESGSSREYQVNCDSGNNITTSFCENCGTTVFWKADFFKGHTGIAVGCFTEPDFPEPSVSAWNRSKLNWVKFPEHWHVMDKQESKNA